jgi:sialic acid synthase SpsE
MAQIISECGINHGGSLDVAIEMIRASKECGAQVVKFQHYLTEILCFNRNDFNSHNILEKNKMHVHWLPYLKEESDRLGVEFLCTPFCKFSAEDINPFVERFKIASPEVCDIEFVKHISEFGKPMIISNGKADEKTLDEIYYTIYNKITLLYCKSIYPSKPSDYDLTEIRRLKERYPLWHIGLSSHCLNINLSIEAAKMGATIIEHHFKLNDKCVDAAVSLNPRQMKKLSYELERGEKHG